jgi:hypothetical protein
MEDQGPQTYGVREAARGPLVPNEGLSEFLHGYAKAFAHHLNSKRALDSALSHS